MARKNRKRKNKNKYRQGNTEIEYEVFYAKDKPKQNKPKGQHSNAKGSKKKTVWDVKAGSNSWSKRKGGLYRGPDHIPLSSDTALLLSEALKPAPITQAASLMQEKYNG